MKRMTTTVGLSLAVLALTANPALATPADPGRRSPSSLEATRRRAAWRSCRTRAR